MHNKYYEGVEFQRCFISYCRQRYSSARSPVGMELESWADRAVVLFAKDVGLNVDYCLNVASGAERYPSYALLRRIGMQECLETKGCPHCGSQETVRWYRFRRLEQNTVKEYNLDAPLPD